ncbi:putative quinol monooxygenase [Paracoccus sp. SCSIO 75233]|uniref:putative quinol monooxygenase n=1 Tax=Paracoccus sp. SCSIO 75233 TaxID=3017782 RepID=UPI0022EFFDF9|nr:putative quinol monooxygenase [Paracoccus sp. SCSIO 75233]WBU52329.1 putative quinol monooxygenase [Paracoccus sp. SCSIO 75233]
MTCSCGQNHAPSASLNRPAPAPGQIALSGRLICVDSSQLLIVLSHLSDHIAASRAEPGCLFFDIAQTDDPLIWQVEELYEDEAALKAHKARTAASIWAEKTAALTRDIHRIDG